MARTPSTMLELGTRAPDFRLSEPASAAELSFSDVAGEKGTVVIFMCNHCPFVKHLDGAMVAFATEYSTKGIGVVAINSNDIENYPDDSPEKMIETSTAQGYPFPYLFDADQSTAKAYRAACTPDFFLFDANRELVYRGQFDSARPGNDAPVDGADLRAACEALLAGKPIDSDQKASLGCNIKWKPGSEPDYFG